MRAYCLILFCAFSIFGQTEIILPNNYHFGDGDLSPDGNLLIISYDSEISTKDTLINGMDTIFNSRYQYKFAIFDLNSNTHQVIKSVEFVSTIYKTSSRFYSYSNGSSIYTLGWFPDGKNIMYSERKHNGDTSGTIRSTHFYKWDISSLIGLSKKPSLPKKLKLSNYPNPFNPSTHISYYIPKNGNVSINIFNAEGKLIKSFHNENVKTGNHKLYWNGKDDFNRLVASGEYFYQVISGDYISTKKMILLR